MKEESTPSEVSGDAALEPYLALRRSLLDHGPTGILVGEVHGRLTGALDRGLAQLARSQPEITLVAVGGYGRGDLCLFSDIDLLLLHEGPAPEEAVRAILYPLWDAGLKVGHATRTVKGTLAFARDDLSALCGLLTARLVTGPQTHLELLNQGLARLLTGARTILPELLAAQERRVWDREPFALQNLHLKEGRGGLRSLHRLDWDRRRSELIGEEPALPVQASEQSARRTLIEARQALHAVQGRAADVYAIELRESVGLWLDRDPLEIATEVYRAARVVDGIAAIRWGRVRDPGTDPVAHAGLSVVRFVRSRWSRREPAATPLSLARAAASSRGRLSLWEMESVARSGPPDWGPGDRSALTSLLAAGESGWEALLGLWDSGWLSRALPEIAHLRGLGQAASFHRHPADAHLGATVSEVVALADAGGWWGELAEETGSLDEILLSAFLHDIGKGLGGDHSQVGADLASALLRRIGYGAATVDMVASAVRHHLLLPETAFRRDIDDPQVSAEIAGVVGNQDLLRVLALLSVADARATGPDMWNAWKESLLRGLVDKVAARLTGTVSELPAQLEAELHSLVPELSRQEIGSHLEQMPPGYLARFGPKLVAEHLRLTDGASRSDDIRMAVVPGAPVSTIATAAQDRPGLLAIISGVLALHNLAVLEARVVTRADGWALDTFRVEDALGSDMVGQGRWPRVREDLEKAVAGQLDLASRLDEKRAAYRKAGVGTLPEITVRDSSIDIRAADRVGLLHDLAAAMAGLGLEVVLAKIDTRGNEAIDVFEVRNPTARSLEEIRTALAAAVGR